MATLQTLFPVVAVTESVIERNAAARAQLAARGRLKADFDLVTACTAIEHAAVVGTNDAALKDGAIEGLRVADPRSRRPLVHPPPGAVTGERDRPPRFDARSPHTKVCQLFAPGNAGKYNSHTRAPSRRLMVGSPP